MGKPRLSPGDRAGRWQVVAVGVKDQRGMRAYRCRCDCGVEREVDAYRIEAGKSLSCGCRSSDVQRARLTTHGMSNSRIYWVWHGMVQRCTNPNDAAYPRYGGRGITVDPRWLQFKNFLEDMGVPQAGLTIERSDNDRGYTKDNCVWATRKAQQRNRQCVTLYPLHGRPSTIREIADAVGRPYTTVYYKVKAAPPGTDFSTIFSPSL